MENDLPAAYEPYVEEKPSEDSYKYPAAAAPREADRFMSLLDRLMGRKNQHMRSPEAPKRPQPQTMVQSQTEPNLEGEDESLEIPAFLRRQNNR